jgi:hypothetical protein
MSDQPPKTVNVHSAVQGHGVATVNLTVNRIVDDSDAIGICALICALGFNAASDLGETVLPPYQPVLAGRRDHARHNVDKDQSQNSAQRSLSNPNG